MEKENESNLNNIKKLLLHVCCANCLGYPFSILKEKFNITLFYFNPNIHPKEEYLKRLDEVKKISSFFNTTLIIGRYEVKNWFNKTEKFKDEPEGRNRCTLCFQIRLEKTAQMAKKKGFDSFNTTLSVSPHKNSKIINEIGQSLANKYNIGYFYSDFKKYDGFKKTLEISKKLNIYRQNYCGCIYSKKYIKK